MHRSAVFTSITALVAGLATTIVTAAPVSGIEPPQPRNPLVAPADPGVRPSPMGGTKLPPPAANLKPTAPGHPAGKFCVDMSGGARQPSPGLGSGGQLCALPSNPAPSNQRLRIEPPVAPQPAQPRFAQARPSAFTRSAPADQPASAQTAVELAAVPSSGTSFLAPAWVKQTPATRPPNTYSGSFGYDEQRDQFVLFGGAGPVWPGATTYDTTWVYASGTWTQQSPANHPTSAVDEPMAFSHDLNQLVLYDDAGVLWRWNGSNWIQMTINGTTPAVRQNASLAWDPRRGGLILFGGKNGGGVRNDTWELDKDPNNPGYMWTRLQVNGSGGAPPPRAYTQMDYSESTSQMVLFGGTPSATCVPPPTTACSSVQDFDDTWTLNAPGAGTLWSQQAPAHKPGPRYMHAMTYDPGLRAVVLFGGGLDSNGGTYGDTWAWNGSDWLQASTPTWLVDPDQPAPNWRLDTHLAADNSGHVVLFGGFAVLDQTSAGPVRDTWQMNSRVPVLSVEVTPSSGTRYAGDSMTVDILASNVGSSQITATQIMASLQDSVLLGSGSQVTMQTADTTNLPSRPLVTGAACSHTTTPACQVNDTGMTATNVVIPIDKTVILQFRVTVGSAVAACTSLRFPVSAVTPDGTTTVNSPPIDVCGGGLGAEDWWSFDDTGLGPQTTARVNVANGNLLVSATDSTPIQAHGQLAQVLRRHYNSQDNLASNALVDSPLGAGWELSLGSTSDALLGGLGVAGLSVSPQQDGFNPLSVAYIDRDGTRHIFRLRSAGVDVGPLPLDAIDLSSLLTLTTDNLRQLLSPRTFPWQKTVQNNYDLVCVDATYTPPPGLDMYLWRYVGLLSSEGSTCAQPSGSPVTIGWTAIRADRLRYDFSATGQLLDTVDSAGNEIVYGYQSSAARTRLPGGGKLDPGVTLGHLTQAYDATCVPTYPKPTTSGCRGYDFDYRTAGADSLVYATDPANRTTTYVVSGSPKTLSEVWDPGNPAPYTCTGATCTRLTLPTSLASTRYTYATSTTPCAGSTSGTAVAGLLCSATDARGSVTRFAYTSPATGAPAGSPPRVLSVTGPRAVADPANGWQKVFSYHDDTAPSYTTVDVASPQTQGGASPPTGCAGNAGCHRTRYLSIDGAGRVGEIDEGSANDVYLRQTGYFWDGDAIAACRQPDMVVDNNLCEVITRAKPSSAAFVPDSVGTAQVNGVTVADQATRYTYGDLGQVLVEDRIIDPSQPWTTSNSAIATYSSHEQYFRASRDSAGNPTSENQIAGYDDLVKGGGKVVSDSSATSTYPDAVLDPLTPPAGYWRLGEGSGTTMYDEAGTNNGTYSDPTLLGQLGAIGANRAINVPGSQYAATVPSMSNFLTGTAFSAEWWVKTASTGDLYALAVTGNDRELTLGLKTGAPWVRLVGSVLNSQSIEVVGQTQVNNGAWHDIAVTYSGSGTASGVKIYVDGSTVGTGTPLHNNLSGLSFVPAGADINLGNRLGQTGQDGTELDEVSVYDSALSAGTVSAHYAAVTDHTRLDAGTLYAITDQTQALPPRGNAPNATWGDYVTSYRRDIPDPHIDGNQRPNNTAGTAVCGPSDTVGNTGLLCETDMPASAGVNAGDCHSPARGGVGLNTSTSAGYTFTCETKTYNNGGLLTTVESPKSHTGPAHGVTQYSYYHEPNSDDGANACSGSGATPNDCDLSGSVNIGGWLKAVTDVDGHSVVYGYDAAGNVARVWDRNATNGKNLTDTWAIRGSAPSKQYTETLYANPVTPVSLGAGLGNSIALLANGTVKAAGLNANGQLGNNTTTASANSVNTLGLTNIVAVAMTGNGPTGPTSGCFTSYALSGDGDVYAWGSGQSGQLGNGGTADSSLPVKVSGLPPIIAIAAGGCHILALDQSGAVWAWGSNSNGQIGNGTTSAAQSSPVRVQLPNGDPLRAASISAGRSHSLAVLTDGSVMAWGANSDGQLGDGTTTARSVPTAVTGLSRVIAVAGGAQNSYAIADTGDVYAWGSYQYGALGNGNTTTNALSPQPIAAFKGAGVRYIAAGEYSAIALMSDGTLKAWGRNNQKQLGGATGNTTAPTPLAVPGLSGITALAGGQTTYMAADGNGLVTLWGYNVQGQLGTGSKTNALSPGIAPTTAGYDLDPYLSPWRYLRATRNATGDLASAVTDVRGDPTSMRPARGQAVFSSAYDLTATYDAEQQPLTQLTPLERAGNHNTSFSYDAFGNSTVVVDPRNHATLTDYDSVNRPIRTQTTREAEATAPGYCPTAANGPPFTSAQTGHRICETSSTYDGLDQTITSTDADVQTARTAYDGLGRRISLTVPRNDTVYANLPPSTWNYDRDGNVLDACPPRQLDTAHEPNATATCTGAGVYSSHNTYDNAGQLVQVKTFRVNDANQSTPLSSDLGYDADGNTITATDANGTAVTTTYDLQDRRVKVTVPRTATSSNSTEYRYDPSGNVTAVLAPGADNLGSGADGDLTVTNPDPQNPIYTAQNPYRIPAGANYDSVTITGGAWISGPSGSKGLILQATGTVSICAQCGITMNGAGGAGAPATTAVNGLDAEGSYGGKGGAGNSLTTGAGGGGGGHKSAGQTGSTTASTAPGAGGASSGTPDFSDVGSDYSRGSGGGGGGGGRSGTSHNGAAGGAGGGFIHITADTITVDGLITANGANGQAGPQTNDGGAGGGAGGGIWLTAHTVTLTSANRLEVKGGTGGLGGANNAGRKGGDGAAGYVRIDADADTVANEPDGTAHGRIDNVTAYSYDADNRLIDTLVGAQTVQANPSLDPNGAGVPDPDGTFNLRTRNIYDPDGRVAAILPPLAFTDAASLTNPDPSPALRTDYDLDGQQTAAYSPRYSNAASSQGNGSDGGANVNQQTAQCPTNPAPQYLAGLTNYGAAVGVCVSRYTYDETGNPTSQILPTNTANPATRYLQAAFTDDNLPKSLDAPDPRSNGGRIPNAATYVYDGLGRTVKVTDALDQSSTQTFTADGLLSATDATGYGTVSHHSTYSYDANGQPTQSTNPRGFTTTTTYTSDGLVKLIDSPGADANDHRKTQYTYDAVGNPIEVLSPSGVAGDATNPDHRATVNSFTLDNLIATTSVPTSVPGTANAYRTTRFTYTPAGLKSTSRTGTCTSSDLTHCVPGDAAWQDGGTLRFTYTPAGANLTQTSRTGKTISTGYDRGGRPSTVSDSATGTVVAATYYLDGLVRTVNDGLNANTYAYNGAGQLTVRSDNPAGSAGPKITSVNYLDAGLPDTMTGDVTGVTYHWTYDQLGRISDQTGGPYTREWSYNPDSSLNTSTTKVGGSSVAAYTYTYDNNGNITNQTANGSATGGDARDFNYTYTAGDQISDFKQGPTANPDATTSYQWDHDGNRTKITAPNGVTTSQFHADDTISTETSPAGTATFKYDNTGRLTSDGTSCTTYDGFDRTSSVQLFDVTAPTVDCASPPTAKTTTNYTYDGLDRQRTVAVQGGDHPGTSTYLYDGLNQTLTGINGLTQSGGGDLTYQLGPGGTHLGFDVKTSTADTISHLTGDGQGNVTQVLNATGDLTCAARYDPFGTPAPAWQNGAPVPPPTNSNQVCNNDPNAAEADLNTPNTIWYRGQSRDPSTGNYQLGSRTYSPGLAGFTTPDTWRVATPSQDLGVGTDPLTANRYSYANGNPVNLDDPTGHMPVSCNGPDGMCVVQKGTTVTVHKYGVNAIYGPGTYFANTSRVYEDTHTPLPGGAYEENRNPGGYFTDRHGKALPRDCDCYTPYGNLWDAVTGAVAAIIDEATATSPVLMLAGVDTSNWGTNVQKALGGHPHTTMSELGAACVALCPLLFIGPEADIGAGTDASVLRTGAVDAGRAAERTPVRTGHTPDRPGGVEPARPPAHDRPGGNDPGPGKTAHQGAPDAAETAGGGSNVVFRGLAEGEDPAAGLTARAPGADVSPISHVAGKVESPWISTSKSLEVAMNKYGKFGVVGIDLSKVGTDVVDVSGGFPGMPGMLSNWARLDQEVLIRDFVPPEAIFFP